LSALVEKDKEESLKASATQDCRQRLLKKDLRGNKQRLNDKRRRYIAARRNQIRKDHALADLPAASETELDVAVHPSIEWCLDARWRFEQLGMVDEGEDGMCPEMQ
jgi:hypothetical protein